MSGRRKRPNPRSWLSTTCWARWRRSMLQRHCGRRGIDFDLTDGASRKTAQAPGVGSNVDCPARWRAPTLSANVPFGGLRGAGELSHGEGANLLGWEVRCGIKLPDKYRRNGRFGALRPQHEGDAMRAEDGADA